MSVIMYMLAYNAVQLVGFDLFTIYCSIFICFRCDVSKRLCEKIGKSNNDENKEQKLLLQLYKMHSDTNEYIFPEN